MLLIALVQMCRPAHALAADSVPFDRHENLIWVAAEVNGTRLDCVLDTGAGRSFLDSTTARRLGLRQGSSTAVAGVDGRLRARELDAVKLQLGSRQKVCRPLAADLSPFSRAAGRKIEAVIGLDFLSEQVLRIDYQQSRVFFLNAMEEAKGGQVVRLLRNHDAFCISLDVEGLGERRLRLDTGFAGGLQLAGNARQMGRRDGGAHTLAISRDRGRPHIRARICKACVVSVPVDPTPRRHFPDEDGLAGNAFLSQFHVTMDFGRQWVQFQAVE